MFDNRSQSFSTCATCPSLCQSACPVHVTTANKSFSPWGIMGTLDRVRRKISPLDIETADSAYRCLTCRACTTACEHGVPVADILSEAREMAVKNGVAPETIQGFIEKFHRHNNPFSRDLLHRLSALLPANIFKRQSSVVYFASCTTIAKCPEVIRDTFSLFKKLGIEFVGVYADPIQCCGYPLHSTGSHYDFVDLAEINYHSLRQYKLIITGSPACAYTLKTTYKLYDFDLSGKVVTINEFLKPYLKNINFRVKRGVTTRLMYHDPCYLSRYLFEADLPRELIGAVSGYPPVEFSDNREHTGCCGQGGCYSIVDKDGADAITKRRLSEAYERKVKTIVTQCPACIFKMKQNGKGLIIRDVVSYLNDNIRGSGDE